MTYHLATSALTALTALLLHNPSTVPVKGSCGTTTPEARACCLGSMRVPNGRQQLFIDGSRQAINVIYSQEFADEFTRYVASLSDSCRQNGPWKGVDPQQTIQELRQQVCGLTIDTYGGPVGLWKKVYYQSIASDGENGDPNSPILLNRWGLANREASEVANTIAHEAAHRIGLTHPSSSAKDRSPAQCEPPYVIGNLVEKLAASQKWDPNAFSCYKKLLRHP